MHMTPFRRTVASMERRRYGVLRTVVVGFVLIALTASLLLLSRTHSAKIEFFIDLAEEFPNSILLLAVSAFAACALALFAALLQTAKSTALIGRCFSRILFTLGRFPFYWLAIAMQFLLLQQLPPMDQQTYWQRLFFPVVLLTLFQAGAYAEALENRPSVKRAFIVFAELLPATLSALIIAEIASAWPGEGRSLPYGLQVAPKPSFFFAYLCLNGLFVVVIRGIAGALEHADAAGREAAASL